MMTLIYYNNGIRPANSRTERRYRGLLLPRGAVKNKMYAVINKMYAVMNKLYAVINEMYAVINLKHKL